MNFSQAELQMISALVDKVWPWALTGEDYYNFRLMQEKINVRVNAVTWDVERIGHDGLNLVRRPTE